MQRKRRQSRLSSRAALALAALTLARSPHARRLARDASFLLALRAGKSMLRGTRNLREASKHVTRFGMG